MTRSGDELVFWSTDSALFFDPSSDDQSNLVFPQPMTAVLGAPDGLYTVDDSSRVWFFARDGAEPTLVTDRCSACSLIGIEDGVLYVSRVPPNLAKYLRFTSWSAPSRLQLVALERTGDAWTEVGVIGIRKATSYVHGGVYLYGNGLVRLRRK